ncbi:HD-GYP domain-containing protein [Paenibacillus sp. 1P07SE]|uniref:HD-GYP domain-containing protein n=1 Tax=Paenibacillus sp. 1P07SE TaxID=3132209 RepID=UPI0039A568D1
MRLVPITMCQPGMKLAKKIFSEDGLVLLGQHVELTQHLIARLQQCGVAFVYIEDAMTEDLVIPEMISDETRLRALSEIRTGFRELTNHSRRTKGSRTPYIAKQFRSVMSMVLDEISDHEGAMIMLMNMGLVDHYLFQHSLNVCIYTTLLGMSDGLGHEELITLGMGALLHDIGKTQIATDVLMKPGRLTAEEFEEMQKHTERGFLLLKDEPNIPLIVAHCAYQHHERLDGSGYPRGIRGKEIHDYAKWIGLVDSYDAMTTNRVYRSPMLPHQAIEGLYAGTGTLYEQRMVRTFRDKIVIYPVGVTVTLNTGVSGVVAGYNPLCPHRPIIRVLYDDAGEPVAQPYEIDMTRQLSVMVTSVNEQRVVLPTAAEGTAG